MEVDTCHKSKSTLVATAVTTPIVFLVKWRKKMAKLK